MKSDSAASTQHTVVKGLLSKLCSVSSEHTHHILSICCQCVENMTCVIDGGCVCYWRSPAGGALALREQSRGNQIKLRHQFIAVFSDSDSSPSFPSSPKVNLLKVSPKKQTTLFCQKMALEEMHRNSKILVVQAAKRTGFQFRPRSRHTDSARFWPVVQHYEPDDEHSFF